MSEDYTRILILGDHQAGKTTLLTTYVNGTFEQNVEEIKKPVYLSPQHFINKLLSKKLKGVLENMNFKTIIYDTEGLDIAHNDIPLEFYKSNMFVYCFKIDSLFNIDVFFDKIIYKLSNVMPEIQVFLLNLERVDDNVSFRTETLEKIVERLKEPKYNNILNLYSLDSSNVNKVNNYISFLWQNINLPLNHLYDKTNNCLSTKFNRIVKLNFQFADVDCDSRLNFRDLREYNKKMFSTEITIQDYETFIIILDSDENINNSWSISEVNKKGLSYSMFAKLIEIYIKQYRNFEIFQLTQYFGINYYNLEIEWSLYKNLLLDHDAFYNYKFNTGVCYSLSESILEKLENVYMKFASGTGFECRKLLYKSDLQRMFEIKKFKYILDVVNMLTFEKDTENNQFLEFNEFLKIFKMPLCRNLNLLIELLVYIGIQCKDIQNAFVKNQIRTEDNLRHTALSRPIYIIHIAYFDFAEVKSLFYHLNMRELQHRNRVCSWYEYCCIASIDGVDYAFFFFHCKRDLDYSFDEYSRCDVMVYLTCKNNNAILNSRNDIPIIMMNDLNKDDTYLNYNWKDLVNQIVNACQRPYENLKDFGASGGISDQTLIYGVGMAAVLIGAMFLRGKIIG